MLTLFELGAASGARYSAFSWRTRMALRHKGLDFETMPVRVSDKAAIAFSGQGKVPVIRQGIALSPLQWARIIDPQPVLLADDALQPWLARMLDLHQGFARSEPAYADRR